MRTNCYLPTANCTNSGIDCSHKAGLRTATSCQLSHRCHLANSAIFVSHVFGLLPALLARGCHSNARFATDWVAGSQCSSPVSNDYTVQSAPRICGVCVGGFVALGHSTHVGFHATGSTNKLQMKAPLLTAPVFGYKIE